MRPLCVFSCTSRVYECKPHFEFKGAHFALLVAQTSLRSFAQIVGAACKPRILTPDKFAALSCFFCRIIGAALCVVLFASSWVLHFLTPCFSIAGFPLLVVRLAVLCIICALICVDFVAIFCAIGAARCLNFVTVCGVVFPIFGANFFAVFPAICAIFGVYFLAVCGVVFPIFGV